MSASKPAISSPGAAKATPAPKKNTVDYIPSKLSYDTAIPVSIFDDRSEFLERCKPYDILDGPNPLDDIPEEPKEPHHGTGDIHTARGGGPSAAAECATSEKSTRSSRKRSRSPLKETSETSLVKEESDGDGRATFTRTSRCGFAAEQLRDGRPYQLLRSRDVETRVRYVLDDCDYDWCAAQALPPEVVQRGITYLEWAYVTSLLTAATPQIDDVVTGDGASPLTPNVVDGVAGLSPRSGVTPTSATSDGGHRTSAGNGLSSGRGKQAAMTAPACTCALCSKTVQVLSQQQQQQQQQRDVKGSARRSGGTSSLERGRGHATGSQGLRGGTKSAVGAAPRATAVSQSRSAASQRSTSAATTADVYSRSSLNSSGSFPPHDPQHKGLRCCECGVVAHLRCWFLTEPPRLPDAWTCDGCTNYARHHKRSAGACCMCGRMGGVLLPYVNTAAILRDDGEGAAATTNSCNVHNGDSQSPLLPHTHTPHTHAQSNSSGDLNTTPVGQSDVVCHAVCALTMPELAIQPKSTILRRNGLVDMDERPYVYALRRVGKQKYAMHCVFCEHGGTGRYVQCHHPRCFEAMHASCAAEAHTVDCYTDVSAPSSARFASPASGSSVGLARSGPCSHGGFSADGGAGGSSATTFWTSCSTYCKKHYGYSVSNAAGSAAAMGDKAEAEALALDLTGLLTGGDGVTSPVVKKRGRGRPPVALVQQREAERELILKLHAYWLERREQRRCMSGQLVGEINARLRPVVEATLRPEIVKVSADKVRLSHFLSLVPEWQWQLVAIVEGELPLPDEEYDEVQKYRKVAHTRRSGNTRSLYDRMSTAATQLDLICRITAAMRQECRLRRTSAELEVESLRKLCAWK